METLTLVLNGDVPVGDFSRAVAGFADLLKELGNATGAEDVQWTIDNLEVSSALVAVRAIGRPEAVKEVVGAFEEAARATAAGDHFRSPAVSSAVDEILGVINGRVESVTFETAREEFVVYEVVRPLRRREPPARRAKSVGAVRGRLQTLSNRGSLRFTLYDLRHDRAVSCYLAEGQEPLVQNLWGELVSVHGMVSRDAASGRPTAVRRITQIKRVPNGDHRAARGAVPFDRDSIAAEEAVRRVRDA